MPMSNFKFWGWDKKPRTMLRFVKPGDIFCFRLDDTMYCFGRIISKISMGHVAEIFDFISSEPNILETNINEAKRIIDPMIIDTYSLFDKKIEPGSEWRIIGHQDDFSPENVDDIYFSYGVGNSCKKVDVFNNEYPITEEDKSNYYTFTSRRDMYIKVLILNILS